MILFDTHIVLDVLGEIQMDLPENIRQKMNSRTGVFVSVTTIWEIAIKHRLGKLELSTPLEVLPEVIDGIGIEILPVLSGHTIAEIDPMPLTKDPFDRLLLGVCKSEGMKLLTIDKALVGHPLVWR
jgi:PIN domain nuclease of toxin-antitoxin system